MIDAVTSLEGKGARSLMGFTPLKTSVVDQNNEVTDEVPAPYISTVGHTTIITIYFLLVGSYLGFSIWRFVERPYVETYSQQPSHLFPPPNITLSLQCFDSPNCGEIVVTRNFSTSPNCGHPNDTSSIETDRTLTSPMQMDLCYVDEGDVVSTNTGDLLETPGLSVDFGKINTGEKNTTKAHAAVIVEAGKMRKAVGLDTWEVKTLFVGMSVVQQGGTLKQTFFAQNLQYDGKRPTWRATYVIRLAQLANVYEVTRPGHWLEIVAQVGGAATIIAAILVVSEPIWAKLFPGAEQRLAKGRMAGTRSRFAKGHPAKQVAESDPETPSQPGLLLRDAEAGGGSHNGAVQANPLPPLARSGGQGGAQRSGRETAGNGTAKDVPSAGMPRQSAFNKGDAVEVEYEGGWYDAEIVAVTPHMGTVDVRWAEGTFTQSIPLSYLREKKRAP